MPYFFGIDITYIIFIIPALLFGIWAQISVQSAFFKIQPRSFCARIYRRGGCKASFGTERNL